MKAPSGRHFLKGLALISGIIAASGLPAACGGDSKGKGGGGNGGNGGAGGDASIGGNGNSAGFLSTTGGSGNAGSSGDSGLTDACAVTPVAATARPVNILLVVDRSSSMTQTPTGFSTNKWVAMKAALDGAVSATQASVNYGMELFPGTSTTDECAMDPAGIQVPIQVSTDGGSTALTRIDAALTQGPNGGTPTAAALDAAYTYFQTGAGASLTGDKYVLLATDGGPDCNASLSPACTAATCTLNLDRTCDGGAGNCCALTGSTLFCLDDVATKAEITKLLGAGIKTIVVGIPGSEAYSTYLDQFALAGGAPANPNPATPPNYYQVDAAGGTQGLTNVLTNITKALVTSCTLQITNVPTDAKLYQTKVFVDFGTGPTPVPYVAGDAGSIDGGTAGFTLNFTTHVVTLLGSTCDQVKTKGAQSVQIVLSCSDTIPH